MRYYLLPALLLMRLFSIAQEKISYYNDDGKEVKEKKATLLVQKLKWNDTLWEVNTYQIDGPRMLSVQFKDENGTIRNGRFIKYDGHGNADSVGRYNDGKRQGAWYQYNSSGHVLRKLEFSADLLVGKIDSAQLHENGQHFRDSMSRGKALVEIESVFPGGTPAWNQYLISHMKYPKRAMDRRAQGKPVVSFIVDKDGHIIQGDIFILHSVEFSIDLEAQRLIRASPDWVPAVQNGKPVKSYKLQPFLFKLT